jgi:hypothetical protein
MVSVNIDHYRICEPLFEGLRVLLTHHGAPYSPAYIQGISGAAFRISGDCPSGPTCCYAMQPDELAERLGYTVQTFTLVDDDIDSATGMRAMIARIKAEIDQQRPVLVWHAFSFYEWDVVCGYDDEQGIFIGRSSYTGPNSLAKAPQTRAFEARQMTPYNAIFLGERQGEFNARQAEVSALQDAVQHAHSQLNKDRMHGPEWVPVEGLLAYERWINNFRNPDKKRDNYDAYCSQIYRQTHRAAAEFLEQIAPSYPEAQNQLQQAAQHFGADAAALTQANALIGWKMPEGPDAERNRQVVEILSTARDAYSAGIDAIEAALACMPQLTVG